MKTLSIFKAKVIEVIDGDTFRGEVKLGFDIRITRSFRVYGIDTPEIFRPKSDMERVKGALRSSGTIALSAILREFSEFLHFANTQRFLLTMQY